MDINQTCTPNYDNYFYKMIHLLYKIKLYVCFKEWCSWSFGPNDIPVEEMFRRDGSGVLNYI